MGAVSIPVLAQQRVGPAGILDGKADKPSTDQDFAAVRVFSQRRNCVTDFLRRSPKRQEATARKANRRLPIDFKALIRRLTVGGHARQQ
jgi:hypothetical protein